MVSCIEPLPFMTLDGAERLFRLTAAEEGKIAVALGSELFAMPLAVAIPRMLFLCLVDPGDLKEETFTPLLPPDTDVTVGFWQALKEHYRGPKEVRDFNERYRPTKGPTQPVNGSISPPSGAPISETSESSGSSDSGKSVQ